jgi:lysozyme
MHSAWSPAVRRFMRAAAAGLVALIAVTGGAASASVMPGIDTSGYQHATSLNWSAVKADGIKFAFLKATEGSTWSDRYFSADWAATGRVGIYHGAYHFARPSIGSAERQARYFVSKIGRQNTRGTLPPVLDLEATGGLRPSRLITWTHTWLSTVEQLTGRTPMIYVSSYFWKDNLANSAGFHRYPLWIANYGVARPMVPGGWARWSFWQTKSTGRVSGISGNVDRDVFNGSMTQLQKFARAYSPSSTSLTLGASNPAPMSGQRVTFSGTLHDASGRPVAGKTVALASQAAGSTTWTQVGTATTSRTGSFSRRIVVSSPGKYRATFSGDADFRGSVSPTTSVRLTPIPTAITLSATSNQVFAGTKVTLSGVLGVSATKPLAGQPVTVSRQLQGSSTWAVLGRTTTDSTGAFSLRSTMLRSASYRAQYAGSTVYAAASSPSQAIAVTLNPSAVSLQVSNTAPYVNQPVRMEGTLVDGATPIAGRTVTLVRQPAGSSTWTKVASVTTDAGGHFTTSPIVDQPAAYRAVFAGDSLYVPSTSGSVSLTITPPAATRLTLTSPSSPTRLTKGRTTKLAGSISTASGEPLAGRSIRIWKRLVGTSRWYRVARTTSLDPRGTWRVEVGPTQSCFFRAEYAGGPKHAAAQSNRVRVNVR